MQHTATILGVIAGLCSTSSFVPQLVKSWREGDTQSISRRMYLITVAAFTLWTLYGWMIGSAPVVIFNLISLCLSGAILLLKLRARRRGRTS
ncbi:MAG TPA: SemiSWEET transporter [Acetobacteraceae bacterium]